MTLTASDPGRHLGRARRPTRRSVIVGWFSASALLGACGAEGSGTIAAGTRLPPLPPFANRSMRVRTGYLFALSEPRRFRAAAARFPVLVLTAPDTPAD